MVFGWRSLVVTIFAGLLLLLVCVAGANYVLIRWAAATNHPWLQSMVLSEQREEAAKVRENVNGHLSAMAKRLGELQAQMSQVESSTDRIAKSVGITTKSESPDSALGGAEVMPQSFNATEIGTMIDELTQKLSESSNQVDVFDALMAENKANQNFFPSKKPVDAAWRSSSFGWRVDPFTGRKAFHEGLDFAAESGTVVVAAASGKVIRANALPQYGKLVEIDHGNGLTTRYAHNSELLVNVGDVVEQGQAVAVVGSTGRSTGTHLHFEVRLNGVAQNPLRFLEGKKTRGNV
jgi:murein DD-endopeptidase MepM/ murein hydrolase activator NlpD